MANLFSTIGVFEYDNLIAGIDVPALVKAVTLKAGQGTLKRGSVLGLITKALGAVVAGTNTGNGTVGTITMGKDAEIGEYKLICTAAATDGGTFAVYAPDGSRMKDANVGAAYTSSQINFTIADGTADFAANDSFTIPVEAGSGQAVLVNSAAVDGSQVADSILAVETAVPAAATIVQEAYTAGQFNINALTFGGTDTYDEHIEMLRVKGIFLSRNVSY